MRNTVRIAVLGLLLAGCAPQKAVTTTFNPDQAGYFTQPGMNTIKGQAFLRQRGGNVVTCAGEGVQLSPVTDYTEDVTTQWFGNANGGFQPYLLNNLPQVDGTGQLTEEYTRFGQCDADGEFEFSSLADGAYYVMTLVTWTADGTFKEGGRVLRRVDISGGGDQRVILTN